MTDTAAKPAPAKRGRPKVADSPGSQVDLSSLSFTEAEMPKRKAVANNPFLAPLGDSYEYDKARSTIIPAVAVSRAEGMLRRAAEELGIGVSVSTSDPDENGNVTITFQGKEKRKRKGKTEDTASNSPAAEGTPEPSASDATASAGESVPTPA